MDKLTYDIVREKALKLTDQYDPEHLLQWARNANFQMKLELKARKREWETMLQDGQEGREAKFEVRTPWGDPSDCMDLLVATIYYDPHSSIGEDYTFCITEMIYAIGLAGHVHVESPLFNCATEQQLLDYLERDDTPFKRYLHLEHIMDRLKESENGRYYAHELRKQQNTNQA